MVGTTSVRYTPSSRERSAAAQTSSIEISKADANFSAVALVNAAVPVSKYETSGVPIPARLPNSGCRSSRSARQSAMVRSSGGTSITSKAETPIASSAILSLSSCGKTPRLSQPIIVDSPTRERRANSGGFQPFDIRAAVKAAASNPLGTPRATRPPLAARLWTGSTLPPCNVSPDMPHYLCHTM